MLPLFLTGNMEADSFDPSANTILSIRLRSQKDAPCFSGRRFQSHWWSEPHKFRPPRSDNRISPIRSTRVFPEVRSINRVAGGRQDFGVAGRSLDRTASGGNRANSSPGSSCDWIGRSCSTRMRVQVFLSFSIAVQMDGKILAGGKFPTRLADRRANNIARF